ncbi:hypothetical protein FIE12Z_7799 [Fusarium flagelliforme]|uniref:Uncharacterized protein n=1 Tax=Fusarium flagelliforme TaxID=2675880 RepID=A0A395MJL7_9HYPO|nr:hypothetical protein FIE12Z_7799 [Fusarium flagelliforme]
MEDIPASSDDNTELAWPDDLPDAPEFQDMDETPGSLNETKSETRNSPEPTPVINTENGILWAQEPKFKHITDDTTGYNITMGGSVEPLRNVNIQPKC